MPTRLDDSQIRSSKLDSLFNNASHLRKPVATKTELPATAADGAQIFVKDEKVFYVFDATLNAWAAVNQSRIETDNQISDLQTQIDAIKSDVSSASGSLTQDFNIQNLTVSGNILPTTTSLQDIGSPTNRFRSLYVDEAYLSTNTLYIGDTPVMGTSADTIMIKADPNQSINMSTIGTGLTQITSVNGVEMSTSGMNGDIKVQATGTGSRVVMSATNEVSMAATNINIDGNVDIAGTTAIDGLTVRGNLTVQGTTTTVSSQSLLVKDNIIEVNQGEIGSGVTAGQAGLKVDRGDAADYLMVFDEVDDMFKVGMVGQLETIASRPYVDGKASTIQTALDNYKTSNDTRVSNIESTNTNQGNSIAAIELELSNARNGQTSLDARLDALDTLVSGKLDATANAVSASKLATARFITLGGDVTGSIAFDGTTDVTITATVADDSHNHVISNIDGLQTVLDGKADTSVATTSANGLMSSTDKTKLDGIEIGAINQTTADDRYIQSAGGNMDGALSFGDRYKIEYNLADDSLDIVVY